MNKIEDIKCFCLHIKATSFYKNTSEWLLLKQLYHHQIVNKIVFLCDSEFVRLGTLFWLSTGISEVYKKLAKHLGWSFLQK